ncbi:2-C-methyl-D-erythritol 2,4-cyclodiphosphate synthase [Helicovermis profundi]|uniref:2-C-methyl-D-erythritol 2,4-cyclodiphosphate synthase n=1 Tax=Helicovermis profundi TaxID=3065157 RepID=A0AAU9ERZ2_9FIRM|nr:2-C-methyl-D-erythritol 2,4-cyclodiphosphate synthase [Clostridia bacterium S502]
MENAAILGLRVGNGYDVHKLVKGDGLILGGVKIPYDYKLLGHSDADVLVHAIMDSLLGASGLKDIGVYFPDTDLKYKGISSLKLLNEVGKLIRNQGFTIINIDSVVIAQKPKLKEFIDDMRKNIAGELDIDVSLINIKATTTEKLGFEGKGEGIGSSAVSLCYKS